jgi:molybdenum cofactor biosynthesis enzyme MoaA
MNGIILNSTIPSLSYTITEKCNLFCNYCTPFGDAIITEQEPIYLDNTRLQLENAIAVYKIFTGVNTIIYRVTGGEPLLVFPLVKQLMTGLRELPQYSNMRLRLNTNGILIKKYQRELQELHFDCIKVSLDTLNRERYKVITGRDRLLDVIEGIKQTINQGLPLELNMVYMKSNKVDFWEILDFCLENKIPLLKVLDLYLINDFQFWAANYENPKDLIEELSTKFGSPSQNTLTHMRGSPMLLFQVSPQTKVLIKDFNQGTTYSSSVCKNCKLFPCQNGMLTVTLTSNGFITPCHLRPDLAINLNDELKNISNSAQKLEVVNKVVTHVLQPFSSVYKSRAFQEKYFAS